MFEDIKSFIVMNNVLSQEDFRIVNRYNETPSWKLSTGNFLYSDLNDIEFFSKYCVYLINEITKTNHQLYRCYRNGMHLTTKSKLHYDTHDKGDITFLLYGHQEWNPEWGGETIFDDEQGNFNYVKPIPNSAVYFSSKHWKHQGRSFTVNAQDTIRISYVWKLKRV